ncbi:hypothetical protein [Bacteroides ovatus]
MVTITEDFSYENLINGRKQPERAMVSAVELPVTSAPSIQS